MKTHLVGRENEISFRKKSERDKIIHSKSFETQEVREIGRKEAEESRGFFILWMRIIEDVFQMEGKQCKDQKKIEEVKKKIHARARKVLWHEIGDFVWASDRERGEVCSSREKFSGREVEPERGMRSSGHVARWSAER